MPDNILARIALVSGSHSGGSVEGRLEVLGREIDGLVNIIKGV